jgi:hypothetical protein
MMVHSISVVKSLKGHIGKVRNLAAVIMINYWNPTEQKIENLFSH